MMEELKTEQKTETSEPEKPKTFPKIVIEWGNFNGKGIEARLGAETMYPATYVLVHGVFASAKDQVLGLLMERIIQEEERKSQLVKLNDPNPMKRGLLGNIGRKIMGK